MAVDHGSAAAAGRLEALLKEVARSYAVRYTGESGNPPASIVALARWWLELLVRWERENPLVPYEASDAATAVTLLWALTEEAERLQRAVEHARTALERLAEGGDPAESVHAAAADTANRFRSAARTSLQLLDELMSGGKHA